VHVTMFIAPRPAQAAVRQRPSRLGPYTRNTSAQDKSHAANPTHANGHAAAAPVSPPPALRCSWSRSSAGIACKAA
jgi:hypothetical protein